MLVIEFQNVDKETRQEDQKGVLELSLRYMTVNLSQRKEVTL